MPLCLLDKCGTSPEADVEEDRSSPAKENSSKEVSLHDTSFSSGKFTEHRAVP